MNTESLRRNTSQPSQFDQAIGTSMRRLLGVNDGYGTPELRITILDELNKLKVACSTDDITCAFSRLVESQNKRKNLVMYVAIRQEETSIIAAVMKCR